MPLDLPVLTLVDAAAWSSWLARSAAIGQGVWLTLAKKGTTSPTSLLYAQALDEALCYGWIDGQVRKRDAHTYSQRFTPRTAKSTWSQRNVEHVARLEREGRMTTLGCRAVDAAKADGRWQAAYAGQSTAQLPPEFLEAVAAVPAAQATWNALTRQNRFAIYFRLNALKTEAGKAKRIVAFVDMLARGETLYPQKRKTRRVPTTTAGQDVDSARPAVAVRSPISLPVGTTRRSARLLKRD
ncbi:bacteriocin-protection, YdeI or OmpD-associated-domain-containing protein [Camillea tinctor]|nr:bacteriocin-protection, YdeI or OmpD-associated-domain-containing protein [Camillea tinctor]